MIACRTRIALLRRIYLLMKMKKINRTLLEWGCILLIGGIIYLGGWHTELIGRAQQGLLFSGLFNPGLEEELSLEEKKYPKADFSLRLRDHEGKLVEMEELKGKVIFLNLWATWCPPCVAEMPGIDALASKLEGEEVVFLMLSLDKDFGKAKAFRKDKNFSFNVHQLESNLPQMYYSQSIPTTYVISADGELVYTHKGMADYDTPKFKEFLLSQKQ